MLSLGYLHRQVPPRLTGKLLGYRGRRSLVRIRLIAMYGSEVTETLPDAAGNFQFPARSGIFILMTVIDRDQDPFVADWRQIRIQGPVSVTIDLSQSRLDP